MCTPLQTAQSLTPRVPGLCTLWGQWLVVNKECALFVGLSTQELRLSPKKKGCPKSRVLNSLPEEFMDFTLFGKTILVVNNKFGLFLANQLRKQVNLVALVVPCLFAGSVRVKPSGGGLVLTYVSSSKLVATGAGDEPATFPLWCFFLKSWPYMAMNVKREPP